VEAWRAMTADERGQFLVQVNDALSDSCEGIGSDDLIDRLTGMVESLEAKARQAEARIEQAQAKVEQGLASMRESILAVFASRGIAATDEDRTRLSECDDLARLQRWLVRALSAAAAAEVLSEP
jgi:hypothetical protein